MRWRQAFLCVLVVVSAATAPRAQDRPVRSDQEILVQLEQDWNAAFQRRNVAVIDGILADEFVATYEDGSRGDKARELALSAEFDQQLDSAMQDEFRVKVYGDTAVVWFSLHLVGASQGRQIEVTLRYTDLFVFRAGRWQCVASQSTKAPVA